MISDPNCTRGKREALKCNYVSAATYTSDETSMNACALDAVPEVGEATLRSLSWDTLAPEEELFWVVEGAGRDPERSRVKKNSVCRAWSTARRRYKSVECDEKLPVFCQSELKGMWLKRRDYIYINPAISQCERPPLRKRA